MSKNKKRYNKKERTISLKGFELWRLAKSNGGILTILITVATGVWFLANLFYTINQNISDLQQQVKNLNTEINQMQSEMEKIDTYLYNDGGVQDQLGDINSALNLKVINVTDENTAAFLDRISVVSNDTTIVSLSKDMPIGLDANGNVYIAEDLINEVILLTYEDEGKDVFFLGKYNENYHWDGYCVTNAYFPDGKLYGICESTYQDGKCLEYKTIRTSSKNEWGYYNRVNKGEINEGVSIEYTFVYDKQMNFTNKNVRVSDIMYVDDFLEKQEPVMNKYYYGSTADGKYNDTSGNAYRAKFYNDGTVEALYVGQFKDGERHDDTGNAWNIAYSEELQCYRYTSGVFKNGYAVNASAEEISLDEIKEIIANYNFGCTLNWREN